MTQGSGRHPAPAGDRLELRHGPLRFTAHAAGLHHPRERPLVLCLHGFPDHAGTFHAQLPALAEHGYRALAPMMRGYEPSSQPADGDVSISALAHDVLAWLDHLGEERVHLVGHDWGAVVTYAVGALAPRRFRSLMAIAVPPTARFVEAMRRVPSQLLDSWYMLFFQLRGVAELAVRANDWALVKRLWRSWSPGHRLPADEWARLRDVFEAPGVLAAMLAYYRRNVAPHRLLDPANLGATGPVRVPTLAITGADDGCIDTRIFDHAFREDDFPAGSRVERVEGAGHFVHGASGS